MTFKTSKKHWPVTNFEFRNVIFHYQRNGRSRCNLYKMKCYAFDKTLLVIVLLSVMCEVACIKCYQCSSTHNRGCFKYNLNSAHLKDCKNDSRGPPICRSLSQINYFTPGQDVTVVRECAYVYTSPLKCTQSKFSNVHYSYVCECNGDGCNSAIIMHPNWNTLICALILTTIMN